MRRCNSLRRSSPPTSPRASRRCMSCMATNRCWRSKPAIRYAPRRAVRVATSARCWSSSPASSGMHSRPRAATSACSGAARWSICGSPPASRASKARACSKTARRIRARIRSSSSRCRAPTARRSPARGSRHSRARASSSRCKRWNAPSCRPGSRRVSRGRSQRASAETLQFLADTTEGNLLAAQQEIEKLALLLPAGELDARAVEQAIADVARFDVFQLSEAWLAGDAARACRILAALEGAGEGVPLLVWQLGEDLHALAAVFTAVAGRDARERRAAQCTGMGQAAGRHGTRRAQGAAVGAAVAAHAAGATRRAGQGHRPRQRVGRIARTCAGACGTSAAGGGIAVDATASRTARPGYCTRRSRSRTVHRGWVVATVMIGSVSTMAAATIINVAFPGAAARIPRRSRFTAMDRHRISRRRRRSTMLATAWLVESFGAAQDLHASRLPSSSPHRCWAPSPGTPAR